MASSGTTSEKMRFTGAQLVVHLLERQGITTVSGIPGGSILPIYDALSQSTQIRHILARHEQGAGFIAQGMARTEGNDLILLHPPQTFGGRGLLPGLAFQLRDQFLDVIGP